MQVTCDLPQCNPTFNWGTGEDLVHLSSFILANAAAAADLAEARDAPPNGSCKAAREPPGPDVEVQPVYLAIIRECIAGDVELDAVLVRRFHSSSHVLLLPLKSVRIRYT